MFCCEVKNENKHLEAFVYKSDQHQLTGGQRLTKTTTRRDEKQRHNVQFLGEASLLSLTISDNLS